MLVLFLFLFNVIRDTDFAMEIVEYALRNVGLKFLSSHVDFSSSPEILRERFQAAHAQVIIDIEEFRVGKRLDISSGIGLKILLIEGALNADD